MSGFPTVFGSLSLQVVENRNLTGHNRSDAFLDELILLV
jgi:hypothetical protein